MTETVTTASALIERANGGGREQVTAHRPLVWHHGIGVMAGGVLVIAGALLPWLTLYAGLQPYTGMAGLYGRLVLAGGALAVAAGALMLRPRPLWMRWGSAILGAALTLFIAWLLVGLRETLQGRMSPMLVAHAGPGLFVAITGAGLVSAAAIVASIRSVP